MLIRLTPGIRPSTHSHVQTGQLDSKFGVRDRRTGRRSAGSTRFAAPGTCGSPGCTRTSARRSSSSSPTCGRSRRWPSSPATSRPRLLNVGGGLGIAYRPADEPPSITSYVDVKVEGITRLFDPLPKILIEPGRSLVGNAGVTLYTVGTVKEIPGVRTYVAVDGGMSDNLRPMLYGSRYEALIADRAGAAPDREVTIAGMHCESGDVLIEDAMLADAARRRRARHAGDRRLRLRDGEQLQRRARARRSSSAPAATPAWSSAARRYDDLTARDV